jgi:hypothetical protein
MKTHTPSTHVRLLLALLTLGGALVARGQLGSSSDELLKRYGPPTLIGTNETGVQTVQYRKDNFDITAFGRAGMALRVIYRKKDMNDQDSQRLLELNRGGAAWAPGAGPGNSDSSSTAWIRSDDLAMAVRKGDEFTVTAAEWNRSPPEEQKTDPLLAAVSNAPVISAPTPPPLPATPRPPKPGKPARRPHPGDSRAAACEILGPPLGGILSGSREILQYPWGQVYLEQGKVVTID